MKLDQIISYAAGALFIVGGIVTIMIGSPEVGTTFVILGVLIAVTALIFRRSATRGKK